MLMRGVVIGGVAVFLAGCATVPRSELPPVRDGSLPGAAASRPGPVPARPDPVPARTDRFPARTDRVSSQVDRVSSRIDPVPARTDGAASSPERAPASSHATGPRPAGVAPVEGRSEPPPPPRSKEGLPREGNSAVVALLESAREAEEARQYGRAAAALERALKVEPRNPRLWHRLAAVRYWQGRHAEAEALALRSMSLGPANRELDSRNWRVIAAARHGQGDEEGAREALRRARAP